jgi:glycosyltransferase involved in cell wall biosynthesis
MPDPLISVVMPVHNGMPFLPESIESILNQTLADFEFVILNNGSTDESEKVLREWALKDSRICLHSSNRREGLVGSSNFVVAKARALLIARMDADDLCEPERLQRQWEVMRDNPGLAAVGTLSDGIDAAGKQIRPGDRWRIVRRSVFPPFPHGSVMFRRQVFEAVGGYRKEYEKYEDQDLFLRMAELGPVVTLSEVLYHYRYHQHNASLMNHAAASETDQSNAGRLSALYSRGAMRLWSGQAPSILRDVLEDKSLKWSLRRLGVTSWAAWASLHPRSLKSVSRAIVRTRDLLARTRLGDGRLYEWRSR